MDLIHIHANRIMSFSPAGGSGDGVLSGGVGLTTITGEYNSTGEEGDTGLTKVAGAGG